VHDVGDRAARLDVGLLLFQAGQRRGERLIRSIDRVEPPVVEQVFLVVAPRFPRAGRSIGGPKGASFGWTAARPPSGRGSRPDATTTSAPRLARGGGVDCQFYRGRKSIRASPNRQSESRLSRRYACLNRVFK
jgi:hypothetical protein